MPGKVVASVEINPIANEIYTYNFPITNLLNLNIDGLSAKFIRDLNVDTILMSPPCQPFSRNGLQQDIDDPRTSSFIHVLELLPELRVENILVENVKGFECSVMRNILVKTLQDNDYEYQEFLLTPAQIGIPNSRLRYYCLARKLPRRFCFHSDSLVSSI